MTQLMFDMVIKEPTPAKILKFKPKPTGLTCSLCGSAQIKLGAYPQKAGKGWSDKTNFHPYCEEDLRKYGTRGT